MILRYTMSGYLYISPEDDCQAIVDAMLATGYNEEFCIAEDFSPEFNVKLMEAGFLVMSVKVTGSGEDEQPVYFFLFLLHLKRSALFFENLKIKKSIKRYLNRYEFRPDADFEYIVDRCVEKHGGDWLTPPLVECIKKIRGSALSGKSEPQQLLPSTGVYPASFALYRDGKLAAGEFGIVCGKIYTSYSGFYEENNAGTVQIILAAQYLQKQGFLFFDLGMPMDYKNDLGAVNISPQEFVQLFREGF
jgi:Leu/Phe-tRNA-protein transferase